MNDEEHEKHFLKKTAKEKTVQTLLQHVLYPHIKPMEQSFPRLN